jgi:hypothetical protein
VWQAAVAQPFNRAAMVDAAGELDAPSGEFWVPNPWAFHGKRVNLSAYEPNRTFLNIDGQNFLDLTYLSGADSEGDARASAPADYNNDGMPDLFVRQSGGGPLLLYENRFPKRHYLKISLRGTKSNSLGIGARITLTCSDQTQVRELYPANSFRSQLPSIAHFGLDQASQVDRLTIRWPSGLVQELGGLPVDQHLRIVEGDDRWTTMPPRRSEN